MVNSCRPASLQEALEIKNRIDAVPYAGGTDLMVENRKGVSYLFLNGLEELKQIREEEGHISIGSCVTFTQALESDLIHPLMKEAVSRIAAPAIRNTGTFGGNIGNGSAKADSVLILYVCGAKLRLASMEGERIIDIDHFYKGRKKLDLRPEELIVEILVPKKGLDNYYYKKVGGRNALAISRVSFAGLISIEDGRVENLAAAFGAVSDTVLRFRDLEAMITGKTIEEAKSVKESFLAAYEERMILTRGRVSAEYRKTVCMNLLKDFLEEKGI
ncbi:xanthine dehydrogenase family protein subunit M [Lacrimispora sp.]|uniref:FAD binding domain-containing protein n=1 Tax=Lacrimispora sp. TaxID=2719234 RepID=UPI003461118D